MIPPRAQLMIRTPSFIVAMLFALMTCFVSAIRGVWTVMTSATLKRSLNGHHLDAELGRPLLGDERVVGNAFHVHGICPFCHFAADPAKADDPERLLVEFDAHELRALPLLLFQARGRLRDIAGEREHHRHRVLGRCKGVSFGRVCHDDTLSGRCLHIDIIHADAGPPDKFQPPACRDHLCGDFGAAPHEQGIVVPDDPAELVLLKPVLTSTSHASLRISSPSSASGSLTSTLAFAIKTHIISAQYLIRVILTPRKKCRPWHPGGHTGR